MTYIIRMTPPTGPVEYLPAGFGFTTHEHTTDPASAWRFPDSGAAGRVLAGYRWPPAFWGSEHRHRRRMDALFQNWRFDVVAAQ